MRNGSIMLTRLAALALTALTVTPVLAKDILFRNARVFDGTGVLEGRTDVLVRDGKIARIAKNIALPAKGDGKTVRVMVFSQKKG